MFMKPRLRVSADGQDGYPTFHIPQLTISSPVGFHPIAKNSLRAQSVSGEEEHSTKGEPMPLITIIITLVVAGVVMWAINTYIPMAKPIKNILNIVVALVLVLWLLQVFGVIGSLNNIRVR
jgi:hypothetical protein